MTNMFYNACNRINSIAQRIDDPEKSIILEHADTMCKAFNGMASRADRLQKDLDRMKNRYEKLKYSSTTKCPPLPPIKN